MRTRLRGPDEAYVRCRACGKTVIGKVGDEFCRKGNRSLDEYRARWGGPGA